MITQKHKTIARKMKEKAADEDKAETVVSEQAKDKQDAVEVSQKPQENAKTTSAIQEEAREQKKHEVGRAEEDLMVEQEDGAGELDQMENEETQDGEGTADQEAKQEEEADSAEQDDPEVSSDCEGDMELLKKEYIEAYTQLVRVIEELTIEIESTVCETTAQNSYDASTVDLVAEREEATTKIEEANGALAVSQPTFSKLELMVTKIEKHVSRLKEECQGGEEVTVYLKVVRDLIQATSHCPGLQDIHLMLPGEPIPPDDVPILDMGVTMSAMPPVAPELSPAAQKDDKCIGGVLWSAPADGYLTFYEWEPAAEFLPPCVGAMNPVDSGLGRGACVEGEPIGSAKAYGFIDQPPSDQARMGCCKKDDAQGCDTLTEGKDGSSCTNNMGCHSQLSPLADLRGDPTWSHGCLVPHKDWPYAGWTERLCLEKCALLPGCAGIEWGPRPDLYAVHSATNGPLPEEWKDRNQCVFKRYTRSGGTWQMSVDGTLDPKKGKMVCEPPICDPEWLDWVDFIEDQSVKTVEKVKPC